MNSLAAPPGLVHDSCGHCAALLCSDHQQRSTAVNKFCNILTGFEDRSIRHPACRVGAIAGRNVAEFPAAVPTFRKSFTPNMVHRTGGATAMKEDVLSLIPSGDVLCAKRLTRLFIFCCNINILSNFLSSTNKSTWQTGRCR